MDHTHQPAHSTQAPNHQCNCGVLGPVISVEREVSEITATTNILGGIISHLDKILLCKKQIGPYQTESTITFCIWDQGT